MSKQTYTVYDSNKVMLEAFTDYNQALKYLQENDDIACYLDDERLNNNNSIIVDPIPVTASPTVQKPVKSKLLSAVEAKQALKDKLSADVNNIINTVIENLGQCEFEGALHPVITSMLQELGYIVTPHIDANLTTVYIPLEE